MVLWKFKQVCLADATLRQFPQSIESEKIYDHERGVDADGSAMTSFITSSDFDISDGEKFTLVKRILPDLDFTGSNASEPSVKMTIKPRDFSGSAYRVEADKNVIETSVGVYSNQIFFKS